MFKGIDVCRLHPERRSEERIMAKEPCSRGRKEQVEVLKRSKPSKCNNQRRRRICKKVLSREPKKIPKCQASEESLMRY